jgi:hypothetical protein
MLVQIQEKARQVPSSEFGRRMKEKAALYSQISRQIEEAEAFRLAKKESAA